MLDGSSMYDFILHLKKNVDLGIDEDKVRYGVEKVPQTMQPQEKPDVNAEEHSMEDYSEDDLNKPKDKGKETGSAVREVPDKELEQKPPKADESKLNERNADPTREEMLAVLEPERENYEPIDDDEWRFAVEAAMWWFAHDWYEGQESNLYSVLSTSKFDPGPMHKNIKDEDDIVAEALWDKLCDAFPSYPLDKGSDAGRVVGPYDESKVRRFGSEAPLRLCNECFKTYRGEQKCAECGSENTEGITEDYKAPDEKPLAKGQGKVWADLVKTLSVRKDLSAEEKELLARAKTELGKNESKLGEAELDPVVNDPSLATNCPECGGTGSYKGATDEKVVKCETCNGTGKIHETKIDEKGWFDKAVDELRADKEFNTLVKKHGKDSDEVRKRAAVLNGEGTKVEIINDLVAAATNKTYPPKGDKAVKEGSGTDVHHMKSVFEVEFEKDGKKEKDRIMAYDEADAKAIINKKPGAKFIGAKEIKEARAGEGEAYDEVEDKEVDHLESDRKGDILAGGKADTHKPEDFDQEQLRMGVGVEREHTNNDAVAMEIAMDHLAEDPEYYTKLKGMEAGKCEEKVNEEKGSRVFQSQVEAFLGKSITPEMIANFKKLKLSYPSVHFMFVRDFEVALGRVLQERGYKLTESKINESGWHNGWSDRVIANCPKHKLLRIGYLDALYALKANITPGAHDRGGETKEFQGELNRIIAVLDPKKETIEGKVPDDKDPEAKKVKKLTEGILELVGEMEGITVEDFKAVRKAVEEGRVENEWPEDEDMIDALSMLEGKVDPSKLDEDVDVRMAYLKYVLMPKAMGVMEAKVNEKTTQFTINDAELRKLITYIMNEYGFIIDESDYQAAFETILNSVKYEGLLEFYEPGHANPDEVINKFRKLKSFKMAGANESKVNEQGTDSYDVVAKGVVDKAEADRLAREKKGMVVADEADPKKFQVLIKGEKNARPA